MARKSRLSVKQSEWTLKTYMKMCCVLIVIVLLLPTFMASSAGEEVIEEMAIGLDKIGEMEGVKSHTIIGTDSQGEVHRLKRNLKDKDTTIAALRKSESLMRLEFQKIKAQLVSKGQAVIPLIDVGAVGVAAAPAAAAAPAVPPVIDKSLFTTAIAMGTAAVTEIGYANHDATGTLKDGEEVELALSSVGLVAKEKADSSKATYCVFEQGKANSITEFRAVMGSEDPTDMELLVITTAAGDEIFEVDDAKTMRNLARSLTKNLPTAIENSKFDPIPVSVQAQSILQGGGGGSLSVDAFVIDAPATLKAAIKAAGGEEDAVKLDFEANGVVILSATDTPKELAKVSWKQMTGAAASLTSEDPTDMEEYFISTSGKDPSGHYLFEMDDALRIRELTFALAGTRFSSAAAIGAHDSAVEQKHPAVIDAAYSDSGARGWNAAYDWCKKSKKRLCNLAEVCSGGKPVRGTMDGDHWVALGDKENTWVAIGDLYKDRICKTHGECCGTATPSWGIKGISGGEALCCA